jgi:quercetin dioxygenase-like cupin family protein
MESFARAPGDGESYWFLGNLVAIKAAAEDTNGLTVVEITAPPSFAAAPHIHDRDDEALYVLEGVLWASCGDVTRSATAGTFVYMPKGVPHALRVEGDQPARWLLLQTPVGDFTSSVRELGQPAGSRDLPSANLQPPDPAAVAATLAKHHIRIVPSSSQAV